MKLYKYTSMTTALKVIESKAVKLSHPNDFNDPFDAKILVDEKNKKQIFDLTVWYLFFNNILKPYIRNLDDNNIENEKIINYFKKIENIFYNHIIKKKSFFMNAKIKKCSLFST